MGSNGKPASQPMASATATNPSALNDFKRAVNTDLQSAARFRTKTHRISEQNGENRKLDSIKKRSENEPNPEQRLLRQEERVLETTSQMTQIMKSTNE